MPGLVRSLAQQALGRRSVEQMHRRHDRFSPVLGRHPPLLQQRAGGGNNSLIAALDHTVLLRRVRRTEVASNTFVDAVVRELGDGELPAVVGVQNLQRVAALLLCFRLEQLHGVNNSVLGGQEGDSHVARGVINHQEEVPAPARGRWRHRVAQVGMDQLQWILSVVLRLLRERSPALLGDDAGVADLLRVLDDGEATRHGMLAELV